MTQFTSFIVIVTITLLVAAQNCHCEHTEQQARGSKTPGLWSALGCVITDADITKCVRDHTTIVTTDRKDETDASDVSSEDDSPGFFDTISAFVSDGIFRFFEDDEKDKKDEIDTHNDIDDSPDDDYDDDEKEQEEEEEEEDEEDDDYDNDGDGHDDEDDDDDNDDDYDDVDSDEDLDDTNNFVNTSNRTTLAATKIKSKRSVAEGEESRMRKRKEDKMMKLMMLGMMLKSKLSTIMMLFGSVMQLKFFGLSMLNLLVGLVRLYLDLTKKKEPQKVIYYEQAHHQHVYDQQHEDKGWLGGWLSKNDDTITHSMYEDPQSMAYSALKPLT